MLALGPATSQTSGRPCTRVTLFLQANSLLSANTSVTVLYCMAMYFMSYVQGTKHTHGIEYRKQHDSVCLLNCARKSGCESLLAFWLIGSYWLLG